MLFKKLVDKNIEKTVNFSLIYGFFIKYLLNECKISTIMFEKKKLILFFEVFTYDTEIPYLLDKIKNIKRKENKTLLPYILYT